MEAYYEYFIDRGLLPSSLLRFGIRQELKRRLEDIKCKDQSEVQERLMEFVDELKTLPIAIQCDKANEQHYEISEEFMLNCLGDNLKYSCCLFDSSNETNLDLAEEAMLKLYLERAEIPEKSKILDLGCGWGSLSLFLAKNRPDCQIVGFSNSNSQREFINKKIDELEITNLKVITGNVSDYDQFEMKFDRIISIEMFEHMKNYKALLKKISGWLTDEGKLFVHIFTHREQSYHFQQDDGWMSHYFFSGGTMPSSDLLLYFQEDLVIERKWIVNGQHYAKTANCWLNQLLKRKQKLWPSLIKSYESEDNANIWFNRWQVFFMACEELFAFNSGNEWFVTHYLFRKK